MAGRRERKQRRQVQAKLNRNEPGRRHRLTAGRTGKVASIRRKSRKATS